MAFEKYGASWADGTTDLKIERACIRKGGTWVQGKRTCGLGLYPHYLNLQKILWPWKEWHKWNLIALKEMVENWGTGFLGPASSGKTHEVASFILEDYWCFPENTTSLVSSTTLRMLEMRIWGEIKKLYADGLVRHPSLPGHLNDSKQRISTAKRSDAVKDFRNGIQGIACNKGDSFVGLSNYAGIKNTRVRVAGDECFVAGTLVDTPTGPTPIEDLRAGDLVISAIGPQQIRGVFRKTTESLFRVRTRGGKEFVCTGNHPFLTQDGFIEACKLNQSQFILSANEGMQILRGRIRSVREQQNVRRLPGQEYDSGMSSVPNHVLGQKHLFDSEVLLSAMREQMENGSAWIQGEGLHGQEGGETRYGEVEVAQGQPRKVKVCGGTISGSYSGAESSQDCQGFGDSESNWSQAENPRWERNWSNAVRISSDGKDARTPLEPCDSNWTAIGIRFPNLLQSGPRSSFGEASDRSGWCESLHVFKDSSRPEEDAILGGDWVDSCEILEQEDFVQYRTSPDGVEVYTLQVAGHHTYSVNGLLTKNCQFMPKSFLEPLNNLSHTPKDFKAFCIGNPKDQTDALGVFCEPKGGWDTMDRTEVTKVWDARMPGVRVVQFVGTDSPNYAFADGQEKYPYLIKRSKIEEHRIFYGPNSIQYAMMDLGMMPVAGVGNRVITVKMCDEHNAKTTAIFEGDVTKVFGIDAAYGSLGGDRCVGIEAWFGKTVDNGPMVFAQVGNPIIVPVNFRNPETPEVQIAKYIKGHCVARGIDPGNVFYDSTGRGSLGTSFGRIWSTDVNPVEFGGKASGRPVSSVDPRPCSEAYGKFVTELWYQVRTAIESNQIRGMTSDVIEDGSIREYMMIDGKKLDVEPKKLTKLRMGQSPDLFDAFVVAFEGARQRGFVIARATSMAQSGPRFWNKDQERFRDTLRRRRLQYA